VLGSDRVRDLERLLRPVDQHGVATLGERRLDLVAAGSSLDEAVYRRADRGRRPL
jgi:hypothetical protein